MGFFGGLLTNLVAGSGLVSSATGLASGLWKGRKDRKAAQRQTHETNQLQMHLADKQMDFQRESQDKQMAYQTGSAKTAMEFEAKEAEKLRNWQEMMSNTRFSAMVKDMKGVGINPVYFAGSSAPMGTGASAKGQAMGGSAMPGAQAQVNNPAIAGTQAVMANSNVMSSAATVTKTIAQLPAEIEKLKWEGTQAMESANHLKEQARLAWVNAEHIRKTHPAKYKEAKARAEELTQRARIAKRDAEIAESWIGYIGAAINQITGGIFGAAAGKLAPKGAKKIKGFSK